MDFKQLEAFVEVAKHKSFSKAAKELYLTQPTVSAHVQKLEQQLDTILVNRSNKAVSLTPSGEIFYSNAIEILNSCKKAIYSVKEYSGKIEGNIDLVCSSIPEAYILPSFLQEFASKYPDVHYKISHNDSQGAIDDIMNDIASFGLVGSKINNSVIEYIDIFEDDLVLITSPDYKIKHNDGIIPIGEIKKLQWIFRKEGSGTKSLIQSVLAKENIHEKDLRILAHVGSNEAIKELVKKGTGVSLVSRTSVKNELSEGQLEAYQFEKLDFTRKFYFIYSKKKSFTPLEKKFLEEVINHYKG